jgi:hypothetical protein
MRHFGATFCWGCLAALVMVFVALLLVPSLDQSFLAVSAIFFLGFGSGYYAAEVRGAHESREQVREVPIADSFRRLIILRLVATWALGYFGASILSRPRGNSAVFLKMDSWIKFSPVWTPMYLTAFPMVVLPILLLKRRRDLLELASAYTIAIFISAVIFVLYPVEVPRPNLITKSCSSCWALYALYWFDSTRNALPSLHASLGLCCCRFSFRVSNLVGILFSVLLVGFLISTIATRQHVILDLLAGLTVAGAVLLLVGRRTKNKVSHDALYPES